jgi:hypothetical protein
VKDSWPHIELIIIITLLLSLGLRPMALVHYLFLEYWLGGRIREEEKMASEIEKPSISQLTGSTAVRLYRESVIREKGDSPTIAMLDLWHSLCQENFGTSIEVMASSRKERQQLRSFRGELNTAYPQIVEGRVVLALLLDSLKNVKAIVITHEIGHWVLTLQGMLTYQYTPRPHGDTEILLNSFAQHPHLYELQRSLGHEPQAEIDSHAEHDLHLLANEREPRGRDAWVRNALLLADDILNCSESYKKRLKSVVKRKHRNTAEILNKILKIAPYYSPPSPGGDYRSSRRPIQKRLIKELQLGTNWQELDEIKLLKRKIEKAAAGR